MKDTTQRVAEITFEKQTSDASTVTIRSADLPEGGFIQIYDTTLAAPLGTSSFLESGTYENVTVSLNRLLTEDQSLIAIAFQDTNGNQQYDPGTDEIYLSEQQPVLDSAAVNVTSSDN